LDWEKQGKDRLRKVKGNCEQFIQDSQIPKDAQEEVARLCVMDGIKLLHADGAAHFKPVTPPPLTANPQVATCQREAQKARTPKLRADFLTWCLADLPITTTRVIDVESKFSASGEELEAKSSAQFQDAFSMRKTVLRKVLIGVPFRKAVYGTGLTDDIRLRKMVARELIQLHRYTDREIAEKMEMPEGEIRRMREALGVPPVIKATAQQQTAIFKSPEGVDIRDIELRMGSPAGASINILNILARECDEWLEAKQNPKKDGEEQFG
jgi:hypothetical protein